MSIFDNFQNSPKMVFTRMSEVNYFGIYFVNIICVCDLPTYCPKSTLNTYKVRKNIYVVLMTIFDKFQNSPKMVFTRTSEVNYFGIYFVNIICVCDLPTYYPKSTSKYKQS